MKGFIMKDVGVAAWADDLPKPPLYPKGVIIRPVAVAMCTSDIHLCESGSMPNMIGKPMGHEVVGVVEEVGPEVQDFKVGDRVLVTGTQPKWRSLAAQEGRESWEGENHYLDTTPGRGGPFGELYSVFDADMTCAKIPDSVDWESALMVTDMITTAFPAVERLGIQFGDSVAVIGIGPVGLMGVAAAKLSGAAKVYAVGGRANCAEVAKRYGACEVISYRDGNYVEKILELNGGPVDKVLICGGRNTTIPEATQLLTMNGHLANVALMYGDDDVHFPASWWNWAHSDRTYHFVQAPGGRAISERYLAMIEAGMFDPKLICTPVFHGMEHIETAYNLMLHRDPDIIKPVIFFE